MCNRIFSGRCEDCYEIREPLITYLGAIVLGGTAGELCEECLASRKSDVETGRPIREIGILAETERQKWVDLEDLEVMFRDGDPPIRLKMRAFVPVDLNAPDASTLRMPIRIKFEKSPNWLCGGINLLDAPHLRINPFDPAVDIVRQMMARYYFPAGSMSRFADVRRIREVASA